MSELAAKECVPCKGGVPPMEQDRIQEYLSQVDGWGIEKGHHLTRTFTFADFKTALDFVNKVGNMAEKQGHHPDLYLAWGIVKVEIWTHKINGLTESDFIFAAKVDQLAR
ncbi:MAG: 4a-hydroxytetrahydrobiopterin dehydratase [Phycisphaerales bacterium]|nr:4a-hydroxytetrahydrobiopterin dehydratase [Phycisphaerales bacterium]